MSLSSTLGFSPRPPVSVYGTGFLSRSLSRFSWKSDYDNFPIDRSRSVLSGSMYQYFNPDIYSTPFNVLFRQYAYLSLLRLYIAT